MKNWNKLHIFALYHLLSNIIWHRCLHSTLTLQLSSMCVIKHITVGTVGVNCDSKIRINYKSNGTQKYMLSERAQVIRANLGHVLNECMTRISHMHRWKTKTGPALHLNIETHVKFVWWSISVVYRLGIKACLDSGRDALHTKDSDRYALCNLLKACRDIGAV